MPATTPTRIDLAAFVAARVSRGAPVLVWASEIALLADAAAGSCAALSSSLDTLITDACVGTCGWIEYDFDEAGNVVRA